MNAEKTCKTCENSCKNLYTIGEAAKLCNVSRKTLRFYEELDILKPDVICSKNGYRYYSEHSLGKISVIKYYKQMGFKLNEIGNVYQPNQYAALEKNFTTKLTDLKKEAALIHEKYTATSDWFDLIKEGNVVQQNNIQTVNVKYLDKQKLYCLDQPFHYDYCESILNVPWVKHLEKHQTSITGAVILEFHSHREKANGSITHAQIMQKPVTNFDSSMETTYFGGELVISTYHIGTLRNISKSYQRITDWAKKNGYTCGEHCYERYVIDYWSTHDESKFVTEILIPARKKESTLE
jgi:DNA-binding transcriptional MerR regulator/effector-binding domain-containing protein